MESWASELYLPEEELDSLVLGPFHDSTVLFPVTELVWLFPAEGEPLLPGQAGKAVAGDAQQLLSTLSFVQMRSGRALLLCQSSLSLLCICV